MLASARQRRRGLQTLPTVASISGDQVGVQHDIQVLERAAPDSRKGARRMLPLPQPQPRASPFYKMGNGPAEAPRTLKEDLKPKGSRYMRETIENG